MRAFCYTHCLPPLVENEAIQARVERKRIGSGFGIEFAGAMREKAGNFTLTYRLTFSGKCPQNTARRKTQEEDAECRAAFRVLSENSMIRTGIKSEPERYYLFAGMGGRAARRKQKVILQCAVVAGVLVSALVAGILYYLSK